MRLGAFVVLALLLLTPVAGHAGALQEGMTQASQGAGEVLEPLGEDADYMGRSAVYGIGAIAAAPFRLMQDILNGLAQGMSKEKMWDHTN